MQGYGKEKTCILTVIPTGTHRVMTPRAGHLRNIMMLIALSAVRNASATSRKLRVLTNHVIPTALIAGEIDRMITASSIAPKRLEELQLSLCYVSPACIMDLRMAIEREGVMEGSIVLPILLSLHPMHLYLYLGQYLRITLQIYLTPHRVCVWRNLFR
jgi:hypothetical protein